VLQLTFVVLVVVTGILGPAWPRAWRVWLEIVAAPLALAGVLLLFGGGFGLGRQLTPFPKPVAEGDLKQGGVYGLVRHPMYGGALLLTFAWSPVSSPLALAPWILAVGFIDAKGRREEAWLLERHPNYEEYRRRVRRRFVPFVW
jgi:protein-S-isoprenylcysteine O-methyltransferase Ste14